MTQDELKELLTYDPETGVFRNRIKRARSVIVGAVAGCVLDNGYRVIAIGGKDYSAHRLAFLYMTGAMPDGMVDHINGLRDDNRFANLRVRDNSLNQQNQRRARPHSASGTLGVHRGGWKGSKWSSEIQHRGVRYRLGTFDTPEEARAAYLAKKREIHEGCTI